jgi:hypothetical protein
MPYKHTPERRALVCRSLTRELEIEDEWVSGDSERAE